MCRREWHKKKCREWREAHPMYGLENRLCPKLEAANQQPVGQGKVEKRKRGELRYPMRVAREVMGTQRAVFLEFMLKVVLQAAREVKASYMVEGARDGPKVLK